ncbi:DUF3267 domain-containing protein [Terribacillus sp. 7520-G]|uniref:DUF3267 domain-containing protein n=1 Tax=Terribacillus TaxID=459532 RepID=UPI0013046704|nr:DUF3267 domain-containing protein [Terribacillus sp. 7520-G]
MQKQEVLFDMKELQKQAAILALGMLFAATFSYLLIHGFEFHISLSGIAVIFLLTIIGIILHELLHGVGFVVFGHVKPNQVKYGFSMKDGAAYAHCMTPITLRAYRMALLLPVILTGLVPLLFSYMTGNGILLTVSVILTAGGVGDWIIFRSLTKYEARQFVMDHPTEVGYFIYTEAPD